MTPEQFVMEYCDRQKGHIRVQSSDGYPARIDWYYDLRNIIHMQVERNNPKYSRDRIESIDPNFGFFRAIMRCWSGEPPHELVFTIGEQS